MINIHRNVIFVQYDNGVNSCKLSYQTDGTACNHRNVQGVENIWYEFSKNEIIPKIFNPNWWYNLYHFVEGYYDSQQPNHVFMGIDFMEVLNSINYPERIFKLCTEENLWGDVFRVEEVNDEMLAILITKHPNGYSDSKVKEMFLDAINNIKPSYVKRIRLADNAIFEEAFVEVVITTNSGYDINGAIVWENCD